MTHKALSGLLTLPLLSQPVRHGEMSSRPVIGDALSSPLTLPLPSQPMTHGAMYSQPVTRHE